MGFGGGTQTFSLGVCTQTPSTGPMARRPIEWDVSNNTHSNRPDKTPPLIPISWARESEVVFDFDTGKFIFKDNPTHVHSAKASAQSNGQLGNKSYWLIPSTARAVAQTQFEKFDKLSDDQQQSFRSAVDSNLLTQEELGNSLGDSLDEPSQKEALSFCYSCEYSNDEEWQLQYDYWMDLHYSAWTMSVKEYALRMLQQYIVPDDYSYISVSHECRTPSDLRPEWTKPVPRYTLP